MRNLPVIWPVCRFVFDRIVAGPLTQQRLQVTVHGDKLAAADGRQRLAPSLPACGVFRDSEAGPTR